MIRRPPSSPLFPSPPLSRSRELAMLGRELGRRRDLDLVGLPERALRERGEPPQRVDLDVEEVDADRPRSEEHTSELQSRQYLVCRLLLEKKKNTKVKRTDID